MAKMQNAIRSTNSNRSRARTRTDEKIEAYREAEEGLNERLDEIALAEYEASW